MDIPKSLRKVRVSKGLSQSEVAEILVTTQQQYCKYENGKREIPIRHILKLCKHYNISVDELLGLHQFMTEEEGCKKFLKLYEETIDIIYHAESQGFIDYDQKEYLLEQVEKSKYEIEDENTETEN